MDPDNYSVITILSCFGKHFTSVFNNILNIVYENNNILCDEQSGFRKSYSTIDYFFSLKMLIDLFLLKSRKWYCAFIDYKKAFGSVNRTDMWHKRFEYNIDAECLKKNRNIFLEAKSCVKGMEYRQ